MGEPETRGGGGGRSMVAGVAWNAAGRGLPLLLALFLTPVLIGQLGTERWGLFTLALAMVGVFGVFDLGVGQALTRALAERIGAGRGDEGAELAGAALVFLLGVSSAAAAALWWCVPALVDSVLLVPPALREQAVGGLRVLAAAAPLVVANAALWGVLAAHRRFREANLVTIPVSLFYYLGPVLVLLVWDSLTAVMLALIACRLANTLSYLWLALPLLPGLLRRLPRLAPALPLVRMGGWMSVSGVMTQALVYADRFLIGALLSLAAVAYYATPLDLVLRAWVLPVAVAQTMLPAIAASFAADPREAAALLRRGALLIMALVLPACLLLVGGARDILWLWLGVEFAENSAGRAPHPGRGHLLQLRGLRPASLLDGIGRPDAAALLSLAEAAVFLRSARAAALAGIEGAAAAWALRAAVDCGPSSRWRRGFTRRRPGRRGACGAARRSRRGIAGVVGGGAGLAGPPRARRGRLPGVGGLRGLRLRRARRGGARPAAAAPRAAPSARGGERAVTPIAVNGRFLTQRITGVQRFASEVTGALDRMAAEGACPPARLLAPAGADASAFPHLAVERFGRLRGQAWEQAELPRRARGSVLVSLGNTAPLLAGGRQAVVIHDAGVFDTPESYSAAFRAWYRALHSALPRGGARVLTVSEFSRGRLAHRLRLDPDRIGVCRKAESTSCAKRLTFRSGAARPGGAAIRVGGGHARRTQGTRRLGRGGGAARGAGNADGGGRRRRSGGVPQRGRSGRRCRRRARAGDGR
jgi:O-antigen/teichoic acid export membrane protein